MKLKKGKLVALLFVIFCSLFAMSCDLLDAENLFSLVIINETDNEFTLLINGDDKGTLAPNS